MTSIIISLVSLDRPEGRAVLEEVPRILPQISYPIEEELWINSHKVWVQDSKTKFTPEWSQELMPNKHLS
jgi:hypothetical protein